jgi:ATP-dependent Clp protease ATP-binding subunit ClpA
MKRLAQAFVAGRGENSWFLRPGPRGVFLFGGPTGVGKTETALQLARILGGGRDALVRVDCQNLQGSGTGHDANTLIWRLLGVAPGYVGHQAGCKDGMLVKVREFPECVLLLDEFEKADNAVGKVLLRILDEGKAQDSEGNELDFRRCFVVLTTNAGVTYHDPQRGPMGLVHASPRGAASVSAEDVRDDLRLTGLGQEFLGRIQHTFLFRALDLQDIRTILERQLDQLRAFAQARHRELEWSPALVDLLVKRWQPHFGVRYLSNLLRDHVLDQLSLASVQGELTDEVQQIYLDAGGNGAPAGGEGGTRRREGSRLKILLS